MKVIIAGGRDFTDRETVLDAIIESEFDITEVVSGGAKGVDAIGEEFAKAAGITVRVFEADWYPNGVLFKGAGNIRNGQMAEYADALIAVWDGESRGTKDMIFKARKLGLKIFVKRV